MAVNVDDEEEEFNTLAELNDNGMSFHEIANVIEELL